MDRVLCHLSGGFDSTASTLIVADSGVEFACVFFDIGQPYLKQEKKAVLSVSKFLSKKYKNYQGLVTIPCQLALGAPGEVEAYIPVRNLVLGSLSSNFAISKNFNVVAVGNKTLELRENDPYCFHDCSRQFYTMLGDISTFASQGKTIRFDMPLVKENTSMTKKEVIEYIISIGFDAKKLWSCYSNQATPCGTCYHCQEVIETGFAKELGIDIH